MKKAKGPKPEPTTAREVWETTREWADVLKENLDGKWKTVDGLFNRAEGRTTRAFEAANHAQNSADNANLSASAARNETYNLRLWNVALSVVLGISVAIGMALRAKAATDHALVEGLHRSVIDARVEAQWPNEPGKIALEHGRFIKTTGRYRLTEDLTIYALWDDSRYYKLTNVVKSVAEFDALMEAQKPKASAGCGWERVQVNAGTNGCSVTWYATVPWYATVQR